MVSAKLATAKIMYTVPRPSKYWDVAPRGFEHISPLQFKAMQGEDNVVLFMYEVCDY